IAAGIAEHAVQDLGRGRFVRVRDSLPKRSVERCAGLTVRELDDVGVVLPSVVIPLRRLLDRVRVQACYHAPIATVQGLWPLKDLKRDGHWFLLWLWI